MNTEMTTRETELERQLSHIVKECEASSTQSKRIQRIKARAEAAINGSDPDFKSVGDRRDDKIAHIGQLNMMNAQLHQRVVELEQSDRKRDVKLLQTLAKMFNYTGLASQFTLLALKRESGEWKPELGD